MFYTMLLLAVSLSSTAVAGSITTTFSSNNTGDGNMFDVVTSGNALSITSLDVHTSPSSGQQTIYLYTRLGSYVGNENSSAGWTLMGSGLVNNAPQGTPVAFDVPDFTLAPNSTFGFYVVGDISNNSLRYTNSSFDISNADLQVVGGVGIAFRGGNHFTADGVFSPREWNGTIYYSVPEPGSFLLSLAGLAAVFVLRRRNYR